MSSFLIIYLLCFWCTPQAMTYPFLELIDKHSAALYLSPARGKVFVLQYDKDTGEPVGRYHTKCGYELVFVGTVEVVGLATPVRTLYLCTFFFPSVR